MNHSLKRSPYSEITCSEFIMDMEAVQPKMMRSRGMPDMHSMMTAQKCPASSEDAVIVDVPSDRFELRRPANSHPQLPRLVVTTLRGSVSEGDAKDNGIYFGLRNEQWKTLSAIDSFTQRHQLFQVHLRV